MLVLRASGNASEGARPSPQAAGRGAAGRRALTAEQECHFGSFGPSRGTRQPSRGHHRVGLGRLSLPGGGDRGSCGWTDGVRGEGPLAQGSSRSRSPAWAPVAGHWSAPGGWARGVLTLAGARRMKGHSCYAMCRAGAALGERAAITVRTDTTSHKTGWAGVRREPEA